MGDDIKVDNNDDNRLRENRFQDDDTTANKKLQHTYDFEDDDVFEKDNYQKDYDYDNQGSEVYDENSFRDTRFKDNQKLEDYSDHSRKNDLNRSNLRGSSAHRQDNNNHSDVI